jgi:hypothetical protein
MAEWHELMSALIWHLIDERKDGGFPYEPAAVEKTANTAEISGGIG